MFFPKVEKRGRKVFDILSAPLGPLRSRSVRISLCELKQRAVGVLSSWFEQFEEENTKYLSILYPRVRDECGRYTLLRRNLVGRTIQKMVEWDLPNALLQTTKIRTPTPTPPPTPTKEHGRCYIKRRSLADGNAIIVVMSLRLKFTSSLIRKLPPESPFRVL